MIRAYLVILIAFVLVTSCGNNDIVKHHYQGEAQGSYYSITYYDKADRNLQLDLEKLLDKFDMSASNYKENSIISRVNRGEDVSLDKVFLGNFNIAQRISKETNGDFDITVRPLVQAWGFGSVQAEEMDSSLVDSILQFVGYKKVSLIEGKIIKTDSRLQLDYDAIAQGYAVDVVCSFIESKGISSYLVDIGGEIYGSEFKDIDKKWSVGIEKPMENATYGENLMTILELSNKGMATSGNYRKFYEKDGIKYAHTISPHTGFPIASRLLSVTVLALNTAEADAYATAFMVMGLEKTKMFLSKHNKLDAYLIYSDDSGEYRYYYTEGLEELIKSK